MELVGDWRRAAARAAGATALAPAVLLIAALLLAAGGGLGGIGSLGQITAGPSVPPAELAARDTRGVEGPSPDVVSAPSRARSASTRAEAASANRTSAATAPSPADQGSARAVPADGAVPGPRVPAVTPAQPRGLDSPPRRVTGSPGASRPPAGAPMGPPSAQDPAGRIIDTTRGLSQALPAPLDSIGEETLGLPGVLPR